MELIHELNVGAGEFFGALAQSAAYDISQAAGKEIKPENIYSGYSYKKKMKNKMGQQGDVAVTVKEFLPSSRYFVSFETGQGLTTVCYEIEEKDEEHILVRYKEDYDSKSKLQNLNYRLISHFYHKKAEKRMRRTLDAVGEYAKIRQKGGKDAGSYISAN